LGREARSEPEASEVHQDGGLMYLRAQFDETGVAMESLS